MSDRTGMLTDRYELTMLDSWVRDGSVEHRAAFELFARRLPEGRRYGVLAGLGRLLPMITDFRFDADEIAWLAEEGVISEPTAAYLRDFRFRGDVDAYREGDLYFPHSPVLTVNGTLGECVVLETLALSVLNHDSAIASAAARMAVAAGGRPLIEMGSRRTHEQAAVAAARAAYLAGFSSTSNLAAGRIHGVPTVGTAAHAFILGHDTEAEAFRSQIAAMGVGTTLLVDTYDTAEGIRTAVRVAGPELGAIRLDSGDLAEEAHRARALLDELGATGTQIVATSDLDEYVISALADAPIDGYGVGTRVVTGSGHPTASMVYKLVAVAGEPGGDATLRPVSKQSEDKVSVGGRKTAWRQYDDTGRLVSESYTGPGEPPPTNARPVQVPAIRRGEVVHDPSVEEIRAFARDALATLPPDALGIAAGAPYLRASAAPEERGRRRTSEETQEGRHAPARQRRDAQSVSTSIATPEEESTMTTDPSKALLVVDVQNDFVEGGSMGVDGGKAVASRISEHLTAHADEYAVIAASRDWHEADSSNGGHFAAPGEEPDFDTTWPVHCVSGGSGAEYAPELATDAVTHHVRKGMGVPAYSAFEGVTDDGTTLADLLRAHGVTEVEVTGIATDFCVRATALDARKEGFAVRLLDGLHAGVAPESSRAALDELAGAGVET